MNAKVSKYIKERAMDLIRRAPRTANELAARLEISKPHARATLLSLARAGVCHLSEWRGIPGREAQAFSWGPGKPALPPVPRPVQVIEAIKASKAGVSVADISVSTGIPMTTIKRIIDNKLRSSLHIVGWQDQPRRGPRLPVYAFGPGEDMPRPDWRSDAERQRKYRSTVNGMEAVRTYECSIERKMAREAVKKARASRERFKKVGLAGVDPLMAAIMGVPKNG